MHEKTGLTLPALLAISLAAGCGVKKEVHQKCVDTLAQRNQEIADLNEQYGGQVAGLKTKKGELSKRVQALLGDMENAEKELLKLRKQREKAEARLASFRKLAERLRELVDTGKLKVSYRNGQMILELPSEILFPSGRAQLKKDGEEALNSVLAILIDFKDRRFMVAGHTDNVPIRSRRFKNNWYLSTARAVNVLEAMLETGFAPGNLVAAGFGEFAPVASNDKAEGRKQNRRIEIILLPDLSDLPNLTDKMKKS